MGLYGCFFTPQYKLKNPVYFAELLYYAKNTSTSNIFFYLCVNDLICNPNKITSRKLETFKTIFLSYAEEKEKQKNVLIYESKDKFILNMPESVSDDLIKIIDPIIDNLKKNEQSKSKKITAVSYVDLFEKFHDICSKESHSTFSDFKNYQLQQKKLLEEKKLNEKSNPIMTIKKDSTENVDLSTYQMLAPSQSAVSCGCANFLMCFSRQSQDNDSVKRKQDSCAIIKESRRKHTFDESHDTLLKLLMAGFTLIQEDAPEIYNNTIFKDQFEQTWSMF